MKRSMKYSSEDEVMEYENAAARVSQSESLELLKLEEEFKRVLSCIDGVKATQERVKRELYEVNNKSEIENVSLEDDSTDEKINKLRELKKSLLEVLVKHKSIKHSAQETVFHSQIQNCLMNALKGKQYLSKTEIKSTIDLYKKSTSLGCELQSELNRTEELEKDVLSLKVQYANCLDALESKWRVLETRKGRDRSFNHDHNDSQITGRESKVRRREGRLEMVIAILQLLITASDKWADNERLLTVLEVCDAVSAILEGEDADLQCLERLKQIRLEEWMD